MLVSNPSSPPSQVCHALVARDVVVGPPEFGTPRLRVRKDVRPAATLSLPLARLCAHCYRLLPRRSRVSQRFCSNACRVAAHRAAGASFVAPMEGGSRCNATHPEKPLVSMGRKAKNRDPYPSADAELWRRIVRLETWNYPPLTRPPSSLDTEGHE